MIITSQQILKFADYCINNKGQQQRVAIWPFHTKSQNLAVFPDSWP